MTSAATEEAVQSVMTAMESRRHFSHWLGQIGHRQDVRLGKGKDFSGYIKAVVENFRNRNPDHEVISGENEEQEMGKKDRKPVVIAGKNMSRDAAVEASEEIEGTSVTTDEEILAPADYQETNPVPDAPEVTASQTADTILPQGSLPVSSPLPQIPGFHLEGATLNQQYAIRRMVILCDCSVQKSPEAIFDVLARNFADVGGLRWWLIKIGNPAWLTSSRRKILSMQFGNRPMSCFRNLESRSANR